MLGSLWLHSMNMELGAIEPSSEQETVMAACRLCRYIMNRGLSCDVCRPAEVLCQCPNPAHESVG